MKKAFTILELLVVIAIIAILAVVAIPNFIGRIQDAEDSKFLAEVSSVQKATAMFRDEEGYFPTEQGIQPTTGFPMNVKFSLLIGGGYLSKLPTFSYWYVDNRGFIAHTQDKLEQYAGRDYVCDKTGITIPVDTNYIAITKEHPESKHGSVPSGSPEPSNPPVVNNPPVAIISLSPDNEIIYTTDSLTWGYSNSTDPDADSITLAEWRVNDGAVSNNIDGALPAGNYTIKLRVQDSKGAWSEWVTKDIVVEQEPPELVPPSIDNPILVGTVESGWTRVDDRASSITYNGFYQYTIPNFHMTTDSYSGISNPSITFKFTGTDLRVYGILGVDAGTITMQVDEHTFPLTLRRYTNLSERLVEINNLSYGEHTVTIRGENTVGWNLQFDAYDYK